jgi:hypothetical protein
MGPRSIERGNVFNALQPKSSKKLLQWGRARLSAEMEATFAKPS